MKKKFSTKWKASSQPRKQRKYNKKAPLHIKRKFLGVNVAKSLRKNGIKRSIPIRKGDVVKIVRGKFRKKQGKVLEVNVKRGRVLIENIQIKKMDGSKAAVPIRASNLQIVELNLEGKNRIKISEGVSVQNKKIIKPKERKNAPKETENTK